MHLEIPNCLGYDRTQLAQRHCDNVVTTSWLALSQRSGTVENEGCGDVGLWRCDNAPVRRCQDVATTLLQRRHSINIWFLGYFITDNSDFFPAIETWESYRITWLLNSVFGKRDAT